MTPERAAALVRRWVRWYTRALPADAAARRQEELAADVDAQVAHGRAAGVSDAHIARHVVSRAIRGAHADLRWRHGIAEPSVRPLRVLAVVGLLLLVPLVLGFPWSAFDYTFAAFLLAAFGLLLQLARARFRRGRPRALAACAVVLTLMVMWVDAAVGVVGDDPTPLAWPMLLAALGLGLRARQRRAG